MNAIKAKRFGKGEIALPSYLKEKVDIKKDSVTQVLEKLSYEATGGKYLVGMWDAPMPNSVNPLSYEELRTWDTRPMVVSTSAYSTQRKRMGKKKVSTMKNFRPRSKLSAFHGYKSEPPSAKVFQDEDPIGPAATAIKAAGELSAIANRNGEDEGKVWDLVEGTWGIDVTKVKKYVAPDVSLSSEKDFIKFTRRSTHMLYGFIKTASQTVVDGGSYKPETISGNRYVDWHRLYLSLRWIGEYVHRYDRVLKGKSVKIAFSPALVEMPVCIPCEFADDLSVDITKKPKEGSNIMKIARETMKYYEGVISQYGVRSYVKSSKINVKMSDDFELSPEVLLAISREANTAKIRLNPSVFEVPQADATLEIKKHLADDSYFPKMVKASSMSTSHQYGYKGAAVYAFEAMFRAKSTTADIAKLQHVMRSNTQILALTNDKRDELKREFMQAVPGDVGFVIFELLKFGNPNGTLAMEQFLRLLVHISGDVNISMEHNYSTAFACAVLRAPNIDNVLKLVQAGYNRATGFIHSTKRFVFKDAPGRELSTVVENAVKDYIGEKITYYQRHYISRVLDYKEELAGLIRELRAFSGEKEDIGLIAGGYIDKYKSTKADVQESITEAKANIITYSFLAKAYGRLTYTIQENCGVHVELSGPNARKLIMSSVQSYLKKRRSWGKELAAICEQEDKIMHKLETSSRVHDMCLHVDVVLNPRVPWADLFRTLEKKTKVTANSLSRVMKEKIDNIMTPIEDPIEDGEEVEEMEDIEPIVVLMKHKAGVADTKRNTVVDKKVSDESKAKLEGYYSALYSSSSSSDSESENEATNDKDKEDAVSKEVLAEAEVEIEAVVESAADLGNVASEVEAEREDDKLEGNVDSVVSIAKVSKPAAVAAPPADDMLAQMMAMMSMVEVDDGTAINEVNPKMDFTSYMEGTNGIVLEKGRLVYFGKLVGADFLNTKYTMKECQEYADKYFGTTFPPVVGQLSVNTPDLDIDQYDLAK